MNQQDYLCALKRSLSGLPAEQVEDILRDYSQHFSDARATGRGDADTARALGDPRKIALEFKALTHVDAYQHKRNLPNFVRMAFALACMAGFNLFVLPLMLVAPLTLLSLYLGSASCVLGGVILTLSGLLGINDVRVDAGDRHIAVTIGDQATQLRLHPDAHGIHISPYAIIVDDQQAAGAPDTSHGGIRALFGVLYVAGGVALFLLCQKLARQLATGSRRYLEANASILRQPQQLQA